MTDVPATVIDTSGRGITRWTLLGTLVLSMAANIGHTLLMESTVSTSFRLVGAICWPLLVLAAVEISVRVRWGSPFSHYLARSLVLVPGIPAAITSYEHMRAVLLAMGERPFIANIGPGAVDLLMIGCTLTLLFVFRPAPAPSAPAPAPDWSAQEQERSLVQARKLLAEMPSAPAPAPEPVSAPAPEPVSAPDWDVWEHYRSDGIAPDAPEPVSAPPLPPERSVPEDLEAAVRALCSGQNVGTAAAKHGVGESTLRRYAKVLRALREDPERSIHHQAERVRPGLVLVMRSHVHEEQLAAIGAGEH